MFRVFAVAILLSCFPALSFAQTEPEATTQPAAPAETTQPAAPAATTQPPAPAAKKPAVKKVARKPASKSKAAAGPADPAESGPCQIGVISAIGEKFAVQKVGITMFGNELTEVPIDAWGLDDLAVARVRAAASGMNVRKVAYAQGAFEPYYHPPANLFRNGDEDLTAVVRQIAASAHCARYFVFTSYAGQLEGTNQSLPGIGVLLRGAGVFSNTSLFANFTLREFDGESYAISKRPMGDLGSILSRSFGRLTQDPLTKLEKEDFPASPADAVNSPLLRDHTRALLEDRLDKTLAAHLKQE